MTSSGFYYWVSLLFPSHSSYSPSIRDNKSWSQHVNSLSEKPSFHNNRQQLLPWTDVAEQNHPPKFLRPISINVIVLNDKLKGHRVRLKKWKAFVGVITGCPWSRFWGLSKDIWRLGPQYGWGDWQIRYQYAINQPTRWRRRPVPVVVM